MSVMSADEPEVMRGMVLPDRFGVKTGLAQMSPQ